LAFSAFWAFWAFRIILRGFEIEVLGLTFFTGVLVTSEAMVLVADCRSELSIRTSKLVADRAGPANHFGIKVATPQEFLKKIGEHP